MTFWHLYTAWALLLATLLIVRLFRGPRCPHAWELVDKTEFCSPLDVYAKHKMNFSPEPHQTEFWLDLCKRKTVVVLRCPKCGDPLIREFKSS